LDSLDHIYKSVDVFLERRDFDSLFFFLGLAAEQDSEFRKALFNYVSKLRLDRRAPWSKAELELLVRHYAHFVILGHENEGDGVYPSLVEYAKRVLKRDVSIRAMRNLITKAIGTVNVHKLPSDERQVVMRRRAAGRKRNRRGLNCR
jgi:hypothetical protein